MTPWLKLYSEIVDDPKVQLLPDGEFRFWVNSLALCNANNPRGTLPEVKIVAWKLHLQESDVVRLIADFLERGLYDQNIDGSFSPHNWGGRNPDKKADASVERVRRYRDKRKALGMTRAHTYDISEILERDHHRCVFCDAGPSESVKIVASRLLPLDDGGRDDFDNLAAVCKSCSNRKSNRRFEFAGLSLISQAAAARYAAYLALCGAKVLKVGTPPAAQNMPAETPVTRDSFVTAPSAQQDVTSVTRYSGVTGENSPEIVDNHVELTRVTDNLSRVTGVTPVTPLEYRESVYRESNISARSSRAPTHASYADILLGQNYAQSAIDYALKIARSRPHAPDESEPGRLARYLASIIDSTPPEEIAGKKLPKAARAGLSDAENIASIRARRLAAMKGEPTLAAIMNQ